MDETQLIESLSSRFQDIEIPQPASIDGPASDRFVLAQLNGSILSQFASWLSSYAELLPSKEATLALFEKAVDAALVALAKNNPVLVRLFGPAVKSSLLKAAGNLYDSIIDRIEV
jgi:hypothetical protein